MSLRAAALALALAAGSGAGAAELRAWIDVEDAGDGTTVFRAMVEGPEASGLVYSMALTTEGPGGRSTTRQGGRFDLSDGPRTVSTARVGVGADTAWSAELLVSGPDGTEARARLEHAPD